MHQSFFLSVYLPIYLSPSHSHLGVKQGEEVWQTDTEHAAVGRHSCSFTILWGPQKPGNRKRSYGLMV